MSFSIENSVQKSSRFGAHLPTRITSILVIAFALGLPAISARAWRDSDYQRVIAKIGVDDLTPQLTEAIADVGVATSVTVAPGETLGNVVLRHCGRNDTNFLQVLKRRPNILGIAAEQISMDYKFTSATAIELPYCLRLTVTATPQDNYYSGYRVTPFDEWDYDGTNEAILADTDAGGKKSEPFTQFRGAGWGHTWHSGTGDLVTVQKYDPQINWATAVDFNNTNPRYGRPQVIGESDGVVATGSAKIPGLLVEKGDTEIGRQQAALPLQPSITPDQAVARLNQNVPAGTAFREGQNGIKLETGMSGTEDGCGPISDDERPEMYPVNTYEILRVLGLNRSVQPRHKSGSMPVIVGDSGLYYDALKGPFAAESVDVADLGDMQPNDGFLRSQHGTYVASAALGGPYFMRFWPLLGSPVVIRSRNIISDKGCTTTVGSGSPAYDNCDVDEIALTNVVSSGSTGAIVNLSIRHLGTIVGMINELLAAKGRFLVIVAAGNTGKEIGADDFPQTLAQNGDHKKYSIVVAALDTDGKTLAKRSSYHRDWVELATFGCKIPVYEYDKNKYEVVRQSGTSVAAPLVAFAAALLEKQMDLSPPLAKKRLIISADYEPNLVGRVKNNAVLNIPRSLALFHDVVKFKEKKPDNRIEDVTVYGRLKGDNFSLALCGGRDPKDRRELRSLSVYKDKDDRKRIFFYYGAAGDQNKADNDLGQDDCLLSESNPNNPGVDLANTQLAIEDAETGQEHPFRLGDAINITLAYHAYWEK